MSVRRPCRAPMCWNPGMPLDPQVEAMRAARPADYTPLYAMSLAEARAADLASIKAAGGTPEPVASVQDHEIPLPVRVYRPTDAATLPALVYYFGGGWTLGTIDTADGICRSLANAAGCAVVAVGYRLAPEHKFPTAVHDCLAGLRWAASAPGIDPDRIAVGGDSAGGNLAAAVTLLARSDGPAIAHQLLVYPNTLYGADYDSVRAGTDPLLFNRTSVDWYWGHYLADPADGLDPLASPLRAPDHSGLPPATVITAEYDPLRDEGEAYAAALAAAGVPVELRRFDGMIHGFFAMAGQLDAGREALSWAAARLRAALTPGTAA
jgi:acetyl esterase